MKAIKGELHNKQGMSLKNNMTLCPMSPSTSAEVHENSCFYISLAHVCCRLARPTKGRNSSLRRRGGAEGGSALLLPSWPFLGGDCLVLGSAGAGKRKKAESFMAHQTTFFSVAEMASGAAAVATKACAELREAVLNLCLDISSVVFSMESMLAYLHADRQALFSSFLHSDAFIFYKLL